MRLLVGLGNPGPKYESTRHNVGFMAVERVAGELGGGPFREKFKGRFARCERAGDELGLLMPLTFMNLSGESVRPAMGFFKVPLREVVVIHDELDLPFGTVRVKIGGGAAGHNGLRSIIQHCGGPDFVRVRVGIGRPPSQSTESYVLAPFAAAERAELPDVLERVSRAVCAVLDQGPALAMNDVNRRD